MAAKNLMQAEAGQRRIQSFAFVIGVVVCVLLCGCFVFCSFFGVWQSQAIALNEKINPNEAPLGSLVRLPGIGIGKASAIVAYRESFADSNNGAFATVDDLEKVSGVGPKTAENISEWLKFE